MRLFRNKIPSYQRTVEWKRCRSGIADPLHLSLSRNLKGEKFNAWATERERERTRAKLLEALQKAGANLKDVYPADLPDENGRRKYSFIPFFDSPVFASLESSDHLTLEIFCHHDDGITPEQAWRELDRIDTLLERQVDWAWNADLGYLTADHGSLGTGLHLSCVFYLIGLKLSNDISLTLNAFDRLHYNVEFCGKDEARHDFPVYRVTNLHTLGLDEPAIIAKTERLFSALCDHEARARYALMLAHPLQVFQHVSSALGRINSAILLSESECMILLTALNFGINMDFLEGIDSKNLKKLIIENSEFSTLNKQEHEGRTDANDVQRAQIVQKALRKVRFAQDLESKWQIFD